MVPPVLPEGDQNTPVWTVHRTAAAQSKEGLGSGCDNGVGDRLPLTARPRHHRCRSSPLKGRGHIGCTSRPGTLIETERNKHAAALAGLMRDLFGVAMRVQCCRLTFDDLYLSRRRSERWFDKLVEVLNTPDRRVPYADIQHLMLPYL